MKVLHSLRKSSIKISFIIHFYFKGVSNGLLRIVIAIALFQNLDFVRGETSCPAGYAPQNMLADEIWVKNCPNGMVEVNPFSCSKGRTHGRGVGYAWSPSSSGQSKCEGAHGEGKCEKWGLFWYPKRKGFHNYGCCLCYPDKLDCDALGLGSPTYNGHACRKKTMD